MRTILVIEDEPLLRDNLIELLEALDFEALVAENGCIGVNLAKSHHPDLILCDVMMPELDGYGVLKTLRQDPDIAEIPFVFLSAKAAKEDLSQAKALGADGYVTKPFAISELLGVIEAQLERRVAHEH